MVMKIYGDQMILINIIAIYIVLTITDGINKIKTQISKKLLISLLVSVLFTICLAINFNVFIRYRHIFLILLVVFYSENFKIYTIIKNYVIINIVSCAIYGFSDYFFKEFNFLLLLLSALSMYIILKVFCYYINFKRFYDISIFNNNTKIKLKALLDTGNLLLDPLTGKPVIIVEKKYIINLIKNTALRKIPYKSLGNENGYFYVFNAEKAEISGRVIKNPVIAIYNCVLSDNGKYNAIISLKHLGG